MSGMLSLPGEILMSIVSFLGPSQHDFDNFDHNFKPDVTLYRLAQTCRTLRDLCIPKLYEICNVKTGGNPIRCLSLLRTLAARPDLASSVKRVIVDASFYLSDMDREGDGTIISDQDAELFNGILEKKLDMTTVAPLRKVDAELDHDGGKEVGKSLACAALALTPNITSIVLSSHYTSLGSFKPGSFPLLEAASVQHADSELGADFDDAQGVIRAAPEVKRFFGWSITTLPETAYPSMKQAVLNYSALSDDQAALIPTAFPNLEKFSYEYGGACVSDEGSAKPRVLGDALLRLQNTLTHIELSSYESKENMFWDDDEPADIAMSSLSPMQALQSLRINSMYIWPGDEEDEEDDDDDEDGETGGPGKLVSLLPKSIRSFFMEDSEASMVKHIVSLAKSAPEKFPELVSVTFAGLEESMQDVVRQAYDKHGIACSFEDRYINGYGCSSNC